MTTSSIYRNGPLDGPPVLALHGLTGFGGRWARLATEHLADLRVVAPDLRGHGRAPWTPPWSFEHIVEDLAAVIDHEFDTPPLVVGHSFGGAVAVHLAHHRPDLVRGLLLLDPAIALDPRLVLDVATQTVESPDYRDAEEARQQKRQEAWGELPPEFLDTEIAEHLVPTRDGRVGWRMSVPAITAYYGELTRELVLPPADLRTVLVQAMKVQPPYVRPEVLASLSDRLGPALTVHEFDCDHMVAFARPAEVAQLLRESF